ncbi:MAG: hypothetical protein HUK28_02345 [Methanobrevibacter sp.]|nr:hypothetical protein [Methanobrevibacter sp.]
MGKILKTVLVIILFIIFFEAGLISSYTIVTTEAPDIKGLMNMQYDKLSSMINPNKVNDVLVKDPTPINVSNKQDVALKMEELSKVDGINIDSINMTTYDDTDKKTINVTIEALGYASPNSTSSQIVISQDPSFKIIATANATSRGEVDTDTIVIQSILKLY